MKLNEFEFSKNLYEIGYQCGKIAEDIINITNDDVSDSLVIVPLRGGLPIYKGVTVGLKELFGKAYETDVMFIPASAIVEHRDRIISSLVRKALDKRKKLGKEYKHIIVLDEAISGSSSKMVFDAVKRGIKSYRPDKYWKRNYWKEIQPHLLIVTAYKGKKLNSRMRKLGNVKTYPVKEEIITTDNNEIYPVEYINVKRYVRSKSGILYPVVSPDVLYYDNPKWRKVVEGIEIGVKGYVKK